MQATVMRNAILSKLSQLKGEPLSDLWRAGCQILEFGAQRPAKNKKGEDITKSDFSIHVEGSWYIKNSNGVILDDKDTKGKAERMADVDDFFSRVAAESLKIIGIDATDFGGVKFELAEGYTLVLERHPEDSEDDEIWRLIERMPRKHFVATGKSFEEH
jgi:hypothetical protein